MINYFEILNVSEHAETEVIHAAYRGLAKKYHPDTTKLPKEIAEKKMADINEAYRILMDDELRESHLRELQRIPSQSENIYAGTHMQEKSNEGHNTKPTYESESEDYGIGFYIIVGVVVVSIICCFLYFITEMLSDTWGNIQGAIREFLSTF